jgi:hypothetical protein
MTGFGLLIRPECWNVSTLKVEQVGFGQWVLAARLGGRNLPVATLVEESPADNPVMKTIQYRVAIDITAIRWTMANALIHAE